MRPGPGKLAAAAVLAVFAAAGCSAGSAPNLLKEYGDGAKVANDRFANVNPQDPAAAMPPSSYESTDDQLNALLSPVRCDAYYNAPSDPDCSPGDAGKVAERIAGDDGEIFARSILVKRDDALELHTLLVVRDGKGKKVVIDDNGQRYQNLTDFRDNNELFGAGDWMLVPRDLTAVPQADKAPADVEAVTVTGHTPGTWGWWMGAGVVLLAVLLTYLWFTRDPDAARKAPDNSDRGMLGSL